MPSSKHAGNVSLNSFFSRKRLMSATLGSVKTAKNVTSGVASLSFENCVKMGPEPLSNLAPK